MSGDGASIEFSSFLFRRDAPEQMVRQFLNLALVTLTAIDVWTLRSIRLPALYESGVRYEVDPPGRELWFDAYVTWKRGKGDCKKLACWRCAELQLQGINAKPYLLWQTKPNGQRTWHVVVEWPDGQLEDPSRKLGMKGSHSLCPQALQH